MSRPTGIVVLAATGTLLLCACRAATGPAGAEALVLRAGQERQLSGSTVYLSMVKVTEDSRCPANAQCIWEGNAAVAMSMRARSDPATTFTLNTTTLPRSVTALGYDVRLDSLVRRARTGSPGAPDEDVACVTAVAVKP